VPARPPGARRLGARRLGPALIALLATAIGGPAFGQTKAESSGAAIYHTYCSYCHDDGTVGAPIVGDAEAWRGRREMGAAALTQSAWQGHNAMPARSIREELTPERVRAAVDYMLERLDAAR